MTSFFVWPSQEVVENTFERIQILRKRGDPITFGAIKHTLQTQIDELKKQRQNTADMIRKDCGENKKPLKRCFFKKTLKRWKHFFKENEQLLEQMVIQKNVLAAQALSGNVFFFF